MKKETHSLVTPKEMYKINNLKEWFRLNLFQKKMKIVAIEQQFEQIRMEEIYVIYIEATEKEAKKLRIGECKIEQL